MTKKVTSGNDHLDSHPLSETVPGEMDGDEFSAICSDIKAHGLAQSIVLYQGKILDGRTRYRACLKLGVKPTTTEFKGTAQQASDYVISANLQRRQLTSMQKAIVAARMCKRDNEPLGQKEAAALVGCSLQSVNLAVRLLGKNNTPLIKRAERGDATRGEIEELLYETIQHTPAANQRVAVAAEGAEESDVASEEEIEELVGDVETPKGKGKGKGTNVIDINDRLPTVGGKRSRAGKVARETPASRVVQAFKALAEADRKHFCDMAWTWLEPAIRAAGRSVVPKVKLDPKKAEEAVAKHKKEDRVAAKSKKLAKAEALAKKGKRKAA